MNDQAKPMEQNADGLAGLFLRLRAAGIANAEFLKVVESIPHERFVPSIYFGQAWGEHSLPIACGQTMPPAELAVRMVHELGMDQHNTVLEIGTGSGFQTALISRLCRKVVSIDRYTTLISEAEKRLIALGITNATFELGDGRNGSSGDGLYDRIVADLAYETMPRELLDQLVSGGVVITAIGPAQGEQMLVKLTKIGNRFDRRDLFPVYFQPLDEGVAGAL